MVSDDPESFADLDGHCNANDWCGSVAGVAAGAWNFVKDTVKSAVQSGDNTGNPGIVSLVPGLQDALSTGESVAYAVDQYSTKGVSGVTNDLLAQGREGATEIVTEAVLTGGLVASSRVNSIMPEATVTRYMGPGEAATATKTGEIPNTNAKLEPRPTHVTTDKPLNSASAAQQKYKLGTTPTHRATVPASRAGKLGPTPDGKPTTSGGGSQAATNKPIPVKQKEIHKLKD